MSNSALKFLAAAGLYQRAGNLKGAATALQRAATAGDLNELVQATRLLASTKPSKQRASAAKRRQVAASWPFAQTASARQTAGNKGWPFSVNAASVPDESDRNNVGQDLRVDGPQTSPREVQTGDLDDDLMDDVDFESADFMDDDLDGDMQFAAADEADEDEDDEEDKQLASIQKLQRHLANAAAMGYTKKPAKR